jgi:16S rRNA processing protein RimM
LNAIEIGRVIKPHGLGGELKVRLHWTESDALDHVEALFVRIGDVERELGIESVRPSPPGVLLKLEGIDDRDAAETLRDALILVPRDALPPLEPGEYYLSDLVGLEVVGPDGVVGVVVEVRTHPSVDAAVVRLPDGKLVEQPLVEPWLEAVDLKGNQLVLSSLEGLV